MKKSRGIGEDQCSRLPGASCYVILPERRYKFALKFSHGQGRVGEGAIAAIGLPFQDLKRTAILIHVVQIQRDLDHAPIFAIQVPLSGAHLAVVGQCSEDQWTIEGGRHAQVGFGDAQQRGRQAPLVDWGMEHEIGRPGNDHSGPPIEDVTALQQSCRLPAAVQDIVVPYKLQSQRRKTGREDAMQFDARDHRGFDRAQGRDWYALPQDVVAAPAELRRPGCQLYSRERQIGRHARRQA